MISHKGNSGGLYLFPMGSFARVIPSELCLLRHRGKREQERLLNSSFLVSVGAIKAVAVMSASRSRSHWKPLGDSAGSMGKQACVWEVLFCIQQGFSVSALQVSGAGGSLLCGAILCPVGCLAASLACVPKVPVARPPFVTHQKVSVP